MLHTLPAPFLNGGYFRRHRPEIERHRGPDCGTTGHGRISDDGATGVSHCS